MNDYILRATAGNGAMRAFFATTHDTVEAARSIHQTTPVMTAALGRLLTGSAIMGVMMKTEQDLLTLTIKGNGPGLGVLATADYRGRVKGYVYNPDVDIPPKSPGKLDVSGALGAGSLTVVKDLGLKEPYVGQVELVSGEIAEDLAFYFAKSEQTPSVVALGVLVDVDCSVRRSGGFIIQLLPGASDEVVAQLEEAVSKVTSVTALLDTGATPEDMLEQLLSPFGYEITDRIPVTYHCNCSQARVEKALVSIGHADIEKILAEDGHMTMNCHFCDKNYFFDAPALQNLLANMKSTK